MLLTFIGAVLLGVLLFLIRDFKNFVEGKAICWLGFLVIIYFFIRYVVAYKAGGHHLIVKSRLNALRLVLKYDQFIIMYVTGYDEIKNKRHISMASHGMDADLIRWTLHNTAKGFDSEIAAAHAKNMINGQPGNEGNRPPDISNN